MSKFVKKVDEYILCAAILRNELSEHIPIYNENKQDLTKCELGFRHADILFKFKGVVQKRPDAQGFFTSFGRFVNRKEAMEIAITSGQVQKENLYNERIGLFSEDLY